MKIGKKISTHPSTIVSAYAPRTRSISLTRKNMAALSELISQIVTYFHAGTHIKPRRVKMHIQMRADRKEHKNNRCRHSESFLGFTLDTN